MHEGTAPLVLAPARNADQGQRVRARKPCIARLRASQCETYILAGIPLPLSGQPIPYSQPGRACLNIERRSKPTVSVAASDLDSMLCTYPISVYK